MTIFLTLVHVIVCLFLVIVVLLQSGKAADLAGAFGGMGSQTTFGARGSATVLSKATTIAAALFMVTSLTLSILATRGGVAGSSVLGTADAAPAGQSAPASTPGSSVPVTMGEPVEGEVEGPSVTLTDPVTGESQTRPLNIPAAPPQGAQQTEQPNN